MAISRLRTEVPSAALRHRPKQQRGQRRVQQILYHAEVVFSEVGFEQATTSLIAERAGISIGSLYQFFTSKEAILEAIANHYLSQTQEALAARITSLSVRDVRQAVNELLELIIKLQERRPYFLQCLTGSQPSPILNHAVRDLRMAIAGQVVALFGQFGIVSDQPRLRLRAQICVDAMAISLPLVVATRGQQRRLAMEEIGQLLTGYILGMRPEAMQ